MGKKAKTGVKMRFSNITDEPLRIQKYASFERVKSGLTR